MYSLRQCLALVVFCLAAGGCGPAASTIVDTESHWVVGRWVSNRAGVGAVAFGNDEFPVKLWFDAEGGQTSWWRLTNECNDQVFEVTGGKRGWRVDGADTVQLLDPEGEPTIKLRRTEDCNIAEFVQNGQVTSRLYRGDYCLREIDNGPAPDDGLERDNRFVCQSYQCGTDYIEDCDEP